MKRLLTAALALSLCLAMLLCACGPKEPAPSPSASLSPSAAPSPTAAPTPTPVPSDEPAGDKVRLAVLSGPTGVGAAKLMAENEAGRTKNAYEVTVAADNQQVTAGLLNGDFDLAALATNVACNLYWKSDGGIQLAALNTLGVLYILQREADDTPDAASLAGLAGRTIYATGQGANPEYVLRYLLTENGLDPDKDVEIVWQAAEEVTATMLQGKGDLCMLPVPAATALTVKSEGKIRPVFDLTREWDALENGSQLTMGCIVVRTDFARENPQPVEDFLEEYRASIEYMSDPDKLADTGDMAPAQLAARFGIVPSAPIAQAAIPQCNLVCITGEDMRETIQGYYETLYAADPASIGGGIPDDGFYFLGR